MAKRQLTITVNPEILKSSLSDLMCFRIMAQEKVLSEKDRDLKEVHTQIMTKIEQVIDMKYRATFIITDHMGKRVD